MLRVKESLRADEDEATGRWSAGGSGAPRGDDRFVFCSDQAYVSARRKRYSSSRGATTLRRRERTY